MDDSLQQLIEEAMRKTQQGRLKWQAFDDESFRVAIGSGHLHIQRGSTRIEDDEGGESHRVTYSVQVSDDKGRVVAEASGTQGFSQGDYPLLSDLFFAARKSALQTDRVVEGMLEALRRG